MSRKKSEKFLNQLSEDINKVKGRVFTLDEIKTDYYDLQGYVNVQPHYKEDDFKEIPLVEIVKMLEELVYLNEYYEVPYENDFTNFKVIDGKIYGYNKVHDGYVINDEGSN